MSKEYHKKKATPENRTGPVSKSTLHEFDKSPWKWAHAPPREPSPAMELGTVVHAIALEDRSRSAEIEFTIAPYDNYRTKEAREWKAQKLQAGLIVLTEREYCQAATIAGRARRAIKECLGELSYEVELEVHGEFNGVDLCGLIDIVPEGGQSLWDLKTCSSIGDMRALQRTIFDRNYHVQAALYSDLYSYNHDPLEPPEFGFVFVETSSPYETTFVKLSLDAMAAGRARYITMVDRWKQLREVPVSDLPGSVSNGTIIDPPEWMLPA